MSKLDEHLQLTLGTLTKPDDSSKREDKKRFSEQISEKVAIAVAEELRRRGLAGARPTAYSEGNGSGAERQMAGGLGAKKVDVTWATEQAGLILGISIKTINFVDTRTGNFQKNLTNRRGDLLMEAVTLHRRFPYSVLCALFFMDSGAAGDSTGSRRSTFDNAHRKLQMFTGRFDPSGREEQFERFYLVLLNNAQGAPSPIRVYEVGQPDTELTLDEALDDVLRLVALRNADFYSYQDGNLTNENARTRGKRAQPDEQPE